MKTALDLLYEEHRLNAEAVKKDVFGTKKGQAMYERCFAIYEKLAAIPVKEEEEEPE
jgi:hypothetical protein